MATLERKEPETNPYDVIPISLLRKVDIKTGLETGIKPGDARLIKAVVGLVNFLPRDPRAHEEVLSIREKILKTAVSRVLRCLPPAPEPPDGVSIWSFQPDVSVAYRDRLREILEEVEKFGEQILKATRPQPDSPRTHWENRVASLILFSRTFITSKTEENCLQTTEEGNWKPIEIVKNSN